MRPLILAHRGAPEDLPENSLAAFKALAELGVDGVELDVQVTADGVPVVAHDVSLGGRRIEQLSFAELREMQGEELSEDVRIPTLDEVLRVIPQRFLVNLELKSHHADPMLASAINGAHSRYRIVVTSFDAPPLVALRQSAPEIRTGLVLGMAVANLLSRVRACLADVVSLHWKLATAELVQQLHANGVGVYVWTVNTPSSAEQMIDLDVDAIITDEPGTIVPLRNRMRPGPAVSQG